MPFPLLPVNKVPTIQNRRRPECNEPVGLVERESKNLETHATREKKSLQLSTHQFSNPSFCTTPHLKGACCWSTPFSLCPSDALTHGQPVADPQTPVCDGPSTFYGHRSIRPTMEERERKKESQATSSAPVVEIGNDRYSQQFSHLKRPSCPLLEF